MRQGTAGTVLAVFTIRTVFSVLASVALVSLRAIQHDTYGISATYNLETGVVVQRQNGAAGTIFASLASVSLFAFFTIFSIQHNAHGITVTYDFHSALVAQFLGRATRFLFNNNRVLNEHRVLAALNDDRIPCREPLLVNAYARRRFSLHESHFAFVVLGALWQVSNRGNHLHAHLVYLGDVFCRALFAARGKEENREEKKRQWIHLSNV